MGDIDRVLKRGTLDMVLLKMLATMGDPREVAAAFMAQVKLHYASFWVRLGAFIVDEAIIISIAGIIALISVFVANLVLGIRQRREIILPGQSSLPRPSLWAYQQ